MLYEQLLINIKRVSKEKGWVFRMATLILSLAAVWVSVTLISFMHPSTVSELMCFTSDQSVFLTRSCSVQCPMESNATFSKEVKAPLWLLMSLKVLKFLTNLLSFFPSSCLYWTRTLPLYSLFALSLLLCLVPHQGLGTGCSISQECCPLNTCREIILYAPKGGVFFGWPYLFCLFGLPIFFFSLEQLPLTGFLCAGLLSVVVLWDRSSMRIRPWSVTSPTQRVVPGT